MTRLSWRNRTKPSSQGRKLSTVWQGRSCGEESRLQKKLPKGRWKNPPPTTNWSWCGRDYIAFPTTTTNKAPHPTDSTLAEEFNTSFSPFEAKCPDTAELLSVFTSHCSLILQEHQVSQVPKTVNIRKAAGLDGVLGKVLRPYADQLGPKTITISPVPKSSAPKSLYNYRPIALRYAVMKWFESLILQHIKVCLPQNLVSHRFAL